jgi:hypothetical protein
MKSYISRKLPTETRMTAPALDWLGILFDLILTEIARENKFLPQSYRTATVRERLAARAGYKI